VLRPHRVLNERSLPVGRALTRLVLWLRSALGSDGVKHPKALTFQEIFLVVDVS